MLVVDDNTDAAEMLTQALTQLRYNMVTAHDGPAALAVARDFDPNVALLDIGLPVMDGYELAERLQTSEDARHTTGWTFEALPPISESQPPVR